MTLADVAEVTVLVVTERHAPPAYLAELGRAGWCRPVGRVRSVAAGGEVAGARRPDVVVVEVSTAERLEELTHGPDDLWESGVLVVSALPAEVALLTCLAAGARGFLVTPVEPGLPAQAVAAVAAGGVFVDPRAAGWLVDLALHGHRARPDSGLTLRQLQVLQLARGGLSNRRIAYALGVSVETVKSHLQEAMRRLGARDRQEAASLVWRQEAKS